MSSQFTGDEVNQIALIWFHFLTWSYSRQSASVTSCMACSLVRVWSTGMAVYFHLGRLYCLSKMANMISVSNLAILLMGCVSCCHYLLLWSYLYNWVGASAIVSWLPLGFVAWPAFLSANFVFFLLWVSLQSGVCWSQLKKRILKCYPTELQEHACNGDIWASHPPTAFQVVPYRQFCIILSDDLLLYLCL